MGVVENFAKQLGHAFAMHNCSVEHLVIGQPLQAQFNALSRKEFDIIFSIGPYPLNLKIDGVPVFEFFSGQFIIYCIDNLIYDLVRNPVCIELFIRAQTDSRFTFIFASDDSASFFLKEDNCSNKNMAKPIFLPMAGFFSSKVSDKREANGRLLVVGNLGALQVAGVSLAPSLIETASENNFFGLGRTDLINLVNRLNQISFNGNVVKAICEELDLDNIDLLDMNFLKFAAALDSYIRIATRKNVILSLKTFHVDFYGEGWDGLIQSHKNHNLYPPLQHSKIPDLCAQYEGLINFDPNFENGVHDRVLTSLGAGTKVITNENSYLSKLPNKQGGVLTYKINDPNISGLAHNILSQKLRYPDAEEIFQKHSWANRVHEFFELENIKEKL